MALFGGKARPGRMRTGNAADEEHLANFVKSRAGVEAYLEPRTTVTETTVVLVAATGEWTRRRVQGADAARRPWDHFVATVSMRYSCSKYSRIIRRVLNFVVAISMLAAIIRRQRGGSFHAGITFSSSVS